MEEKFLCGIVLGMIGGAVIVANSAKIRQMVKDGQAQIEKKVEELSMTNKKES